MIGSVLTHVDLVGERIVYNLEETDDVGMVDLLHDRNLLANLMLCAAKLVGERGVGRAGDIVLPPELGKTVCLVLATDTLDGLHGAQEPD